MNTKILMTAAACFALFSTGISVKHAKAEDGTTAASMPVVAASSAVTPTSSTVVTKNADGSTTTTTTTAYYVDYDKNNNGILDSNEFYTYAYRIWDTDRDGFLSDEEWKLSTARWYGPADTTYRTYTYWDKNGDGKIDATEFDTTVASTKLYSIWDVNADNQITNDEYAAASFRVYDLNNDGMLSMDEWKAAL